MSAISERTTEVHEAALRGDDRSLVGAGMVLMVIVSLSFWGAMAFAWLR